MAKETEYDKWEFIDHSALHSETPAEAKEVPAEKAPAASSEVLAKAQAVLDMTRIIKSGKDEKAATPTDPKRVRMKVLKAIGVPVEIVRQFVTVRLHDPYTVKTYGKLEIKQVVADKIIDFPLDWKKDVLHGNKTITTVKMHAILSCNPSQRKGNIRIAALPEKNDPTCTIWYFEQCKLTSITWVNGDGSMTDTGNKPLPRQAASQAISSIASWLGNS